MGNPEPSTRPLRSLLSLQSLKSQTTVTFPQKGSTLSIGPGYLAEVLVERAGQLEGKTFTPLPAIQRREEIDQLYRYTVAPLMLKCFEDTLAVRQ